MKITPTQWHELNEPDAHQLFVEDATVLEVHEADGSNHLRLVFQVRHAETKHSFTIQLRCQPATVAAFRARLNASVDHLHKRDKEQPL